MAKIELNPYELEWMLVHVAKENMESYIKISFCVSNIMHACYPRIDLFTKITPKIYELIKSLNCELPIYELNLKKEKALEILITLGD
jgi:hypothetical protein